MNFEDAVNMIDALRGEWVESTIWSAARDGPSIATLCGCIERVGLVDEVPAGIEGAIVVEASVFRFGSEPTNVLTLWPDRFVSAARVTHGEGVEVVTKDAVIRITKRQPWID
jgi:hypothetical protein